MIPIHICDDEQLLSKQLERLIKNQIDILGYDMGPVMVSKNPEELLGRIGLNKKNMHTTYLCSSPSETCELSGNKNGMERSIYFLDVDFPGYENGFELASEIRRIDPRGFIIFITAHQELAAETFHYRLEAMDYIVKGDEEQLKSRIQSCLISIEQRICDESNEDCGYFSLRIFDTVRHIPLHQMLYFEALGRKHQIRLHMKEEILDFYGSLQQLEEELSESFWRCHRGYLVNRKHIHQIHMKENEVELTNKERCLLSRRAKSKLSEELMARA